LSSRKINVIGGNIQFRDRQIALFVDPKIPKSQVHQQVVSFRLGRKVSIFPNFLKKYEKMQKKTLIFEIAPN